MRLIPTKAGEWTSILLCLLKIYVVSAYIVRDICFFCVWGAEDLSIFSPTVMATGYVLCIIGLSFAAVIQYKRKKHEGAFLTFLFILIGLAFLHLSFQGTSDWDWMIPGVDIWANGWIVCCCFVARRHFKTRAFTCWIWASSINLICEIGIQFCAYPSWHVVSDDSFWRLVHDYPLGNFLEFYWMGYITAGALYVSGLILAIQQMHAKDLVKPSLNTSMFVALGTLVLMIGLAISISVFRHPEFLPAAAVNGVVCLVSLNACRRQTPAAFLCLALASALTIARTAGLDLHQNWRVPPQDFEQWLFEILMSVGFMTTVFWYGGMVLIIQRIAN